MKRRFFLTGLSYLGFASLLSGCGGSSNPRVSVQILRRSLPIQLLRGAKQTLDPKTSVKVSTSTTMAELYGGLQKLSTLERPQNLAFVGLGDYWLVQAIQTGLIEPLTLSKSVLDKLPQKWTELVQRNTDGAPDPSGQIWGAPYRWGATVLIYRKDKIESLGWQLKDWDDLWKPALEQRIGLLNQPREVIGMVLKTLGQTYNEADPKQQRELSGKLRSLHRQTRTYSSKNYIEPLILGDTWVAMGWSSDIIPALAQDENLGVIFPKSGSTVWADVWVRAKNPIKDTQNFPADQYTKQWVEHWWSPDVAKDIANFTNTAPVLPISPPETGDNSFLSEANLEASEFLLPLTPEAIAQYRSLWQEMRQA